MDALKVDVCIIGAGSGGLSVAAAASQMGATVALVEEGKMGGDCLNYGCVPSKALLAAAKTAEDFRAASWFGIDGKPQIDFQKVMAGVQQIINTISPNDSVERFTKLGVHVLQTSARFINKNTVKAGDTTISARRFVIAAGSIPAIPNIPGLENITYFTNETIFKINKKPEHLIIIGGGPIGCELAQAFLLLGIKVTILEAFIILPRDEEDLAAILRNQLLAQGLTLFENAKITDIKLNQNQIQVQFEKNGQKQTIVGSDLLVAAGRRPNISQLNLETAGVRYSSKGISVNNQLRTSNKHIYAIGDVIGSYQFTHIANYHAGIVIKNILFHWPAKVDYRAVPWVTYTEPELAHVGLTSAEASKQKIDIKVLTWDFKDNDRAQTERRTLGKIKILVNRKGIILGVSILGAHAGELLLPWIIAIQEKKSVRAMTNVIVPYPTLSEISKRVAGEFYTPLLFSEKMRRIVRFLRILG